MTIRSLFKKSGVTMSKRVVITGWGTVNPLAQDVDSTWEKMLNGESGIAEITEFDITDHKAKIGGEVKDFDVTNYNLDKKVANKMDKFQQYAYADTSKRTLLPEAEKLLLEVYVAERKLAFSLGTSKFSSKHLLPPHLDFSF